MVESDQASLTPWAHHTSQSKAGAAENSLTRVQRSVLNYRTSPLHHSASAMRGCGVTLPSLPVMARFVTAFPAERQTGPPRRLGQPRRVTLPPCHKCHAGVGAATCCIFPASWGAHGSPAQWPAKGWPHPQPSISKEFGYSC